ncbi:MAG TPA: molybdopterin-guanine dinucleotide biosynthesis protein B [Anaerolineae bacterium]|nr:molybdopterin-guanine dinucleotide biosynthesis protein B [Anaerolineae bacterium]
MSDQRRVPIISLVGKSGVGKTTALERIIRELKARGYRIGTVKHHKHLSDIDIPGKDSWRHAEAGSDVVAISGPQEMALIRRLQAEMPVEQIVRLMDDVDIVITEGYKEGDKPKIEVSRKERGTQLLCSADELIGLMADYPIDMPVPRFALEDAAGVVDLLEKLYLHNTREVEA